MTYTITKEFSFDASHQLSGLAEGHKCMRLHGHTYRVTVVLETEALDSHGFVLDYGDLAPFKVWIDASLDHRHLNDIIDGEPTAERLAAALWQVVWTECALPDDAKVRIGVSETPKTWAWYSS